MGQHKMNQSSLHRGGVMLFQLVNAEYDRDTERAYVEFRAPDNDGDEIIATTIFSFHSESKLTAP
jgi:hypothetical protein